MKKKIVGFLIGTMAILMNVNTAFAGNINNAEQRIVNYMNRIFSYNGVRYVATEEAKQKVIDKLMSDDCDYTSAEVDNYILQASRNIYKGIQEGYLVEYVEDIEPETKEEPTRPERPTEVTEEATENVTEASTEASTNIETEQATEADRPTRPNKETEETTKVNVEQEIKDVIEGSKGNVYDSEGNEIQPGDPDCFENGPVTIEKYDEGVVNVIDKDGNVIFTGTLPVKNTGYDNKGLVIALIVMVAGLTFMCVITVFIRKKKFYNVFLSVGILVIGIAAVVLGGKEFIKRGVATWKNVWITGAPRYEYNNVDSSQIYRNPVLGSQYGEIICEDIDLRAPLYYGDTNEIFDKGVGTWIGSTLPGRPGSALIGGHDSTYFAPLEQIKEDAIITVKTTYGTFKYKVTGTLIAGAEDTYAYAMSADMDELILYTCYPFGNSKNSKERFYVYAERINAEKVGA